MTYDVSMSCKPNQKKKNMTISIAEIIKVSVHKDGYILNDIWFIMIYKVICYYNYIYFLFKEVKKVSFYNLEF
jgi:hypothetical protein